MTKFYQTIGTILYFVELLILIRVVISMVGTRLMLSNNLLVKILFEVTDPILQLARSIIVLSGLNTGYWDFSPILAIFLLRIVYVLIGKVVI